MKTGRITISGKTLPTIQGGWYKVTKFILGSLAFLLMIWAFASDAGVQPGYWDFLPDIMLTNGPASLGSSVGNGKDVYFIGSQGSDPVNTAIWKWSADDGWQLLASVGGEGGTYQANFFAIATDGKYLYAGGKFGGSYNGVAMSPLSYPNSTNGLTATNIARYNLQSNVWEGIGYVDISPSGQDGWIKAITTDARGNVYVGTSASSQPTSLYTNVFQEWNGYSWTSIGSTNWGLLAVGYAAGITALGSDGYNVYIGGDIGGVIGPNALSSAVFSHGIIKYRPLPPPCPPSAVVCPRIVELPGWWQFSSVGGDMEPSTVASPGGVFVPPGVFSSTNDYNNDPTYHSYWNDPIGANGIGVSGGGVSSIAVVGTEVWVAGGFLLPAFGIARFPTVESRLSNNNLPIDNLLNTYGPPYNVAYPGWGNSIAVVKGDGVPIPYVQGSFNSIGGPGSPGVSLVSGTNGIWANAIAYWFDVYETGPTNQTIWEPLSTNGLTSAGSPAYQCYIAATPNAIYAGGVFDAAGGNSVPFSGGNVAAARWLVATNFAIPEDQTNFTFYSGTNYSISSNIQFSGTTTIEPGATITCSNNTMEINGDLICPSIASATLNGGTLNISNNSSLSSLSNLSFAGTTLDFQLGSNSPGTITVSDCRFVDGGITWGGVASTYTLVLNNCLAVNPPDQAGETGGSTNTFLSDNTGHGSFELVNCTLDNWYYPVHNNNYPGSGGGDNFSAINCIFSEIALAYGGGDSPSQTSYSGSNNGFYEYAYDNGSQTPFGSNQTTNDWPFYQSPTIDDSSYYLATNSACHNVGTAGIDPALLAELRQRTTYSPGDGGFPDNYGNPDLGYHYESANPGTPCFPTPPGVVAGWSAESNAVDSINGNDGTFTGTESYAPGEVGLAFHFNGSSDVEVPDSSTLHFTNGMTVEAWVNLSNYTGHATEILSKLAAASLFANSYTFSIEGADTASTRRAYFTVVGTNYVAHQLFSSTNIPTNQWMHIAGTYDGATISIYVNGALSASAPFTNEIWPGTEPLSIGCSINGSPVSLFDGQIDEVNLYNRALTADEVQGIYYAGNAGKCLTLQP